MAFYPRSAWGGRNPSAGPLGRVGLIAIHHTAASNAPAAFDANRWKALEAGEVSRGYASLAYHFGVNHGGDQIEIRGWGQKGAATGGHNSDSVAIVYDGYFHPPFNDEPTEAAINAIADLIVVGVFLGWVDPGFVVQPHGVLTAGTQWSSACPGDNLRPRVKGWGSIEAIAQYKLQVVPPGGPVVPAPGPPATPRCVNTCSQRVLKQGSSGVCVKTLQNLLIARGFNPGPVDGKFGSSVKRAVVCAQGANGLVTDGIVGPATWGALGA